MKAGIFICMWLTPLICWGNELLLEATKQKLSIQKLQGLQVNKECAANSKACLAVLSQAPTKSLGQGPEGTVGHPASKFCGVKGGSSVILVDEKHNQYDYCIFQGKYFVDSWDLYRKYKK